MYFKALVPVDLSKLKEAKVAIDAAEKLAPQITSELIIMTMKNIKNQKNIIQNTSPSKIFESFIDSQSGRLKRVLYGRYCLGEDLMTEVTAIVDKESVDLVVIPPNTFQKPGEWLGSDATNRTPCSILVMR